jgi:hypothetical protein
LFIQAQQLQSQHLDVFVQQQVVPSTSTATTPTSSTTTTTSKDDDECGSRKFWRSRSRRGQIGIHIKPLLGGEIESRPRNRRQRARIENPTNPSKVKFPDLTRECEIMSFLFNAKINAMACSATESGSYIGTRYTSTPNFLQLSTSTLSKPAHLNAIIFTPHFSLNLSITSADKSSFTKQHIASYP